MALQNQVKIIKKFFQKQKYKKSFDAVQFPTNIAILTIQFKFSNGVEGAPSNSQTKN